MDFSASVTQDSSEESLTKEENLFPSTGAKPKFNFPPPPRFSKSANNSYCSTASESSNSSHRSLVNRSFNLTKKKHKTRSKNLPPLGIYWDIENCHVPKSKSAAAVVQKIREVFLHTYRESEFVVVCDVKKESPLIIQELHDAQVMVIHVSATSKNAADEKLRQALRRFGELHPAPSGVVLISGDVNFAADLSDLRYRKKIRVILVHNVNVADALILCANEHHSFAELMKDISAHKSKVIENTPAFLTITNLPSNYDIGRLRSRLRMLTENCGGKICAISSDGIASVRFGNLDYALRAQRRIQGEDVFGNKIKVLSPSVRNFTGRKMKNADLSYKSYDMPPPPPPGFSQQDYHNAHHGQSISRDSRRLPETSNQSVMDNCMFRPIRGAGVSNVSPMDVGYEQIWGGKRNLDRRALTPREQLLNATCGSQSRTHKNSGSSEYSDEQRMGYMSENEEKHVQSNQPVDLIISNLDPTIETKELRRLLTNMLKEYAMILSLNVTIQADGTPIANIRVNSQKEAQFTISQLHRQKLGHKRIVISYAQSNSPDPEQLKAMVIGVLQEVPDKCMPLFKFLDLLESRYNCTVSVSEVNKLKDVCKITDDLGSRIISLTQEIRTSPPPSLSRTLVPYCTIHCPNGIKSRGWCEFSVVQAPSIKMSLKLFTDKLTGLLKIHLGCMHLLSFQACYEQEFHEPLPVDETGVPLEHLISCVPHMEIRSVGPNKNIKVIKYEETLNSQHEEDHVLKSMPPSLAPNISLLCRELVDLLKTTDRCQLLLSKFIPAYHHHFGRQCRVADYGYTKLLDLFESISHVAQIMGDGTRRTITLSHTAQMRRFTSDLLRVLKVQPSKQISIIDFPQAYEKVLNKTFNAVEYGLCTFEDLLQEVPENTIVISKNDAGIFIAVPKREQTAEEIVRTKQFAAEVIDLLRHSPYYTMLFNKFVPAYHHHFGHQCKVSDYGFTKLIELFEAIPDIVKIEEMPDGERTVSLTLHQSLKILGSQIVQIIRSSAQNSILISDLPKIYLREFGYPLKHKHYECNSILEVTAKLSEYVQVENSNAGLLLVAIDVDTTPNTLKVRSWALLLKPPHYMDFNTFCYEYQSRYNSSFTVDSLQQIENVISISSSNDTSYISLTPLFVLAAQLYHVIYNSGGSVPYFNLDKLYYDFYGNALKLSNYQIYSVDEFYNYFSLLFFIRGSKKKSIVMLNRNLAEHLVPLPTSMYKSSQLFMGGNRELSNWPPPQPTEMVQNTIKKVSPPKPDTPPTPDTNPWTNCWNSHSAFDSGMNLSIQMPILQNPKLLGNPDSLISPARLLLPLDRNPWNNDNIPSIAAPDPTELPMPDKLISKDDSADSGVNEKLDISPSDTENENNSDHQLCGKKLTFAAYLNFNN
ncbi:meiosis regulator and mRNA stability factor 1-like protein isoform X2 [Leptinotarsa decemlineata]|uniref:meiosis regulator and mRNA stability factor 1-like protein isoform X2 n=1 Tax=Leptinotarsa decemlineata TaxID=7539 RepID=UPI003D30A7E3